MSVVARRTYHQHCALARALDLVGERWTLLLVRELLTGRKRYNEFLASLPGMGTNLLATRLRDMTEAGLVEHDGSTYGLTSRGAELEEAVLALARFGVPLLAAGPPDDLWRPSWNVLALRYTFRPDKARNVRGVIEYRVDADVTQARIRNGVLETTAGRRWQPDVIVQTDGDTFLDLADGTLAPGTAEAEGDLQIEGSRRLFNASLRVFGAT